MAPSAREQRKLRAVPRSAKPSRRSSPHGPSMRRTGQQLLHLHGISPRKWSSAPPMRFTPPRTSLRQLGRHPAPAAASVPSNRAQLGGALTNPLGRTGELGRYRSRRLERRGARTLPHALPLWQLGAFSYLLFILALQPCVATIGVIYKEIGSFSGHFLHGMVGGAGLKRRRDLLSNWLIQRRCRWRPAVGGTGGAFSGGGFPAVYWGRRGNGQTIPVVELH